MGECGSRCSAVRRFLRDRWDPRPRPRPPGYVALSSSRAPRRFSFVAGSRSIVGEQSGPRGEPVGAHGDNRPERTLGRVAFVACPKPSTVSGRRASPVQHGSAIHGKHRRSDIAGTGGDARPRRSGILPTTGMLSGRCCGSHSHRLPVIIRTTWTKGLFLVAQSSNRAIEAVIGESDVGGRNAFVDGDDGSAAPGGDRECDGSVADFAAGPGSAPGAADRSCPVPVAVRRAGGADGWSVGGFRPDRRGGECRRSGPRAPDRAARSDPAPAGFAGWVCRGGGAGSVGEVGARTSERRTMFAPRWPLPGGQGGEPGVAVPVRLDPRGGHGSGGPAGPTGWYSPGLGLCGSGGGGDPTPGLSLAVPTGGVDRVTDLTVPAGPGMAGPRLGTNRAAARVILGSVFSPPADLNRPQTGAQHTRRRTRRGRLIQCIWTSQCPHPFGVPT